MNKTVEIRIVLGLGGKLEGTIYDIEGSIKN